MEDYKEMTPAERDAWLKETIANMMEEEKADQLEHLNSFDSKKCAGSTDVAT
jgi:hypothetical protein